jgi:hypothetical protein
VATNRGGVNVPVSATWNGRALKTAESQLTGFKRSFGKAFMGIGAAAGAVVGINALGDALVGMAKNAAEDQKSVAVLAKTVQNLGFAGAQGQVEDFISALSLQTGVVDDELRPAFDRLLRSTGSVEEAQRATTIALDAAKSSGRSTVDVAMLLGKAYDGNTMALARAGFGIDTNILKTKDMAKITAELARITGGQAAAATLTYAGKLERASVAASEAGEAVGYELLRSLDTVTSQLGGPDGFIDGVTMAGDVLAGFVAGVGDGTNELLGFAKAAAAVIPGVDETETSLGDVALTVGKLIPGIGLLVTSTEGLVRSGQANIDVQSALAEELQRAAAMRDIYAGKTRSSAYATDVDTAATEKNTRAKDRLQKSLDRLYGNSRSNISQRLSIREGFAEGPGKKASPIDVKQWAISQAGAISSLASDLYSQGKQGKALAAYNSGRQQLMSGDYGLGKGFINSILGPAPGYLPGQASQEASAQGASRYRKNMGDTFHIQTVNVNAETPTEALEKAKRYARLRAMNGRNVNPNLQGVS